ncbi:MAG: hypothetical protein KA260_05100 [Burkholderiales bacterium]|nr:hypothetical protein [Burkholderiales bacterium]
MLAEVLCDGVPCVLVHSGLYGVDEFLTKVELIKLIARITDDDASPAKQEMEDLWALAPNGSKRLVPRKEIAKLANKNTGGVSLKALSNSWVITTGLALSVDAQQRARQPQTPPPRLLTVEIPRSKMSRAPDEFRKLAELYQRLRLSIRKPRVNSKVPVMESIENALKKIESKLHEQGIGFDRRDIPCPIVEFVYALGQNGARFALEESTLVDEYFSDLGIRFHNGAQPKKLREYLAGLGLKPQFSTARR